MKSHSHSIHVTFNHYPSVPSLALACNNHGLIVLYFKGLTVMVLMIPLNALVYRNIRTYQMEQMKNKDRRNKMMDEILNGMKIIKLYAWESSFLRKVNDIRDQEIYALKVRNYYYSTLEFQAFLYSLLAGFICKSMRCQIGYNL